MPTANWNDSTIPLVILVKKQVQMRFREKQVLLKINNRFDIQCFCGWKLNSKKRKDIWLVITFLQKRRAKEEHCYHGNLLPNKRLTYEKCFVHLLVDYKLNPNFKLLILFRQGLTLKLQKLPLAIDIPMCKNLSHFYTTYIIVRFLPLVIDHNPSYKS